MYTVFIVLHVVACVAVILVVLLQKGKGADLGAAFGGSSQTVFGSQGAGGLLTKLVAACVAIFMVTSLSLAYVSSHRDQTTVMEGTEHSAEALPESAPSDASPDEQAPPAAAETEASAVAPGDSSQSSGE